MGHSEANQVSAEVVADRPLPAAGDVRLMVLSARWVPVSAPLSKMLERVRKAGVEVVEIDVDVDPGPADALGVSVLPAFVREGATQTTLRVGALSADELIAWIREDEQ